MKLSKYILLVSLALTPASALADTIPAFPMAFWGNVSINGSAAPTGTTVRAYYGSTLAGTATVNEAGVYGYTEPIKQKLVVGAGTGPLTFTVQSSAFNSGAETGGSVPETYAQFTSGSTTEMDLAFTIPAPVPVSTGGGGGGGGGGGLSSSGSSGGGGGGGGGGVITPVVTVTPTATTTVTTVSQATNTTTTPTGAVLGASAYNFSVNLKLGASGADVTALQQLLTEDGVYAGPITGHFGPLTLAGVKAYQTKYGIQASGFVGPLTRAQLNKGTLQQSSGPQIKVSSSSTLTVAQVQAILGLLQSFGADQATINRVAANLGATT